MNMNSNYLKLYALVFGLFMMVSCDDDETIEAPLAFFSAEVSEEDNLIYTFTDKSLNADTYLWNFGDESTSTDASPIHTYAVAGNFTVTLVVTNGGGTHSHEETITVLANAAKNLIVNGEFEDESAWTVINMYECTNDRAEVKIADGVATLSETETAEDGGWKHMGIYQELTLEAGTYNVDLHVEYAEIADIWGEVFVGVTIPVACTAEAGTDYTDNRVLVALNAWDCNQAYAGSAVENACNVPEEGNNGEFTIATAGTYYFLFKVGGGSYGNGIVVDNISLFKQ